MTCGDLHLLTLQRFILLLMALARILKANTTESSPFQMFSSPCFACKSFLFIRGGLLTDEELDAPGKRDDKNFLWPLAAYSPWKSS